MNQVSIRYLNKKQVIERFPFLTENMIKNILFKNIGNFREKVVRKIGRRLLFDEEALVKFISESK